MTTKRPTSTARQAEAGSIETPPTPVAEKAAAPEMRAFRVVSQIDHDGTSYLPGNPIVVDRHLHERFLRGQSIASAWAEGDDV